MILTRYSSSSKHKAAVCPHSSRKQSYLKLIQTSIRNARIYQRFVTSSLISKTCLICILDGMGAWSTKGCKGKGFHNQLFKCSCNHMTNFAILLDVTSEPLSQSETKSLSIITYIGCTISLVSLVITVLTYLCFR